MEKSKITLTSGFRNMGNTCYMNSALQALFASTKLTQFFVKEQFKELLRDNTIERIKRIHHRQLKDKEEKEKKNIPTDKMVIITLDKENIIREIHNTLVHAYYITVNTWYNENSIIIPESFKMALGRNNRAFEGLGQQDAQECVSYILDEIHENIKIKISMEVLSQKYTMPEHIISFSQKYTELKNRLSKSEGEEKQMLEQLYYQYINTYLVEYIAYSGIEYWKNYISNGYSIVRELFTGLTLTETKCTTCMNTSLSYEPFISLQLAIPLSRDTVDLNDCLKEHTNTRIMAGNNKYQCLVCKDLKDAQQKVSLFIVPEIMIIHLKRYTNDDNGRTRKNTTNISFPLNNLNLKDYLYISNQHDTNYELYGVIQQSGSLNSGHYVALCKNSIDNKWNEFNDAHVYLDIPEKVINNNEAYVLFYRKV